MNLLKIIIIVLLIPALFLTQLAAMFLFTVNYVSTPSKIEQLIVNSGVVEYTITKTIEFVETEVENQVINHDQAQMIENILVESEFSQVAVDYLSDFVINTLEQKEMPQLNSESILQVLNNGFDQIESNTNIKIEDNNKQAIIDFVNNNSNQFVNVVNDNIKLSYQTAVPKNVENLISFLFNPWVKAAVIALLLLIGLLITLLLWPSKKGLMLCGVITLASALIFVILGLMSSSIISSIIQKLEIDVTRISDTFNNMILIFGAGATAVGVILIGVYLLAKRKTKLT